MPREFYLTGIKGLFYRCNKCIDVKGDYIKNNITVLPVSVVHHTELQNFLVAPRIAIFNVSKAISRKRCKIAGKLVLITDGSRI